MLRIICVFVWLSCTNELLSHFLTSSKYLVSCSCYVFLHIAEQICSPLSWVFLERRHIHFIIWKILLRYDSWRVSWIGFSFLFWLIFLWNAEDINVPLSSMCLLQLLVDYIPKKVLLKWWRSTFFLLDFLAICL